MDNSKKDITQPVPVNSNQQPSAMVERTAPISVGGKTEPTAVQPSVPTSFPEFVIQPPGPKKPKKPGHFWKRFFLVVGGILLIAILGSAGGWLGYNQALANRMALQDKDKIKIAVAQYQLGVVDLQASRFEIARQRFEYVIRIDPSFPGAAQKWTESMLAMATITVPTIVPSPTVVPTADTRNVDQKYASSVTLINTQNWDGAIDSLMSLRKTDGTYKAVDVDGMLYTALRQRGVHKIGSGDLEGGIYDLALAERFAPLDHDADGFRAIARQYIIGVSFWEFDWGQVYDYFKQIAAGNPGMVDSTGMTAQKRFAVAAAHYGDMVFATADYCNSVSYYSQSVGSGIVGIAATATYAAYKCSPPTAEVTPTPSPTGLVPAATATPTPGGGVAQTAAAQTAAAQTAAAQTAAANGPALTSAAQTAGAQKATADAAASQTAAAQKAASETAAAQKAGTDTAATQTAAAKP